MSSRQRGGTTYGTDVSLKGPISSSLAFPHSRLSNLSNKHDKILLILCIGDWPLVNRSAHGWSNCTAMACKQYGLEMAGSHGGYPPDVPKSGITSIGPSPIARVSSFAQISVVGSSIVAKIWTAVVVPSTVPNYHDVANSSIFKIKSKASEQSSLLLLLLCHCCLTIWRQSAVMQHCLVYVLRLKTSVPPTSIRAQPNVPVSKPKHVATMHNYIECPCCNNSRLD
jgi:hypothetical protein